VFQPIADSGSVLRGHRSGGVKPFTGLNIALRTFENKKHITWNGFQM